MCGINGIVNFSNKPISVSDSENFQKSLNSMKSRGPDSQALCQGPNWLLGHTRLSIIDLNGGAQPLKDSATGVTLSYNGEIYNYKSLKGELQKKGHVFRTVSDTEVLLRSYLEWGELAFTKINGCFAFAIIDPRIDQLILVRDRLGVKPLYYSYQNNQLVFASTVAALLKVIGKQDLEPTAISHYFTTCRITFGEKTLLKNVANALPGTQMYFSLSSGELKKSRYWQRPVVAAEDKESCTSEELLGQTKALMKDAVSDRLMSDVPLGCFLSGGLDSAIVATLASEEKENLPFYCAGSSVEKYNEFEYASAVASKVGGSVENVIITADTFFEDWKHLIKEKGLPLSTPNETSIYRLSKKLSESCKVTLTGEGADEVFGGYLMPHFGIYDYLHSPHSPEAADSEHPLYYKLMQRFGRPFIYNEADHFFLTHSWMPVEKKASLFQADFWESLEEDDEVFTFYEDFLARYDQCSAFDRRMHLHAEVNLEGLLNRVDSSTMAAPVEARVPFTDYRVVDFAFRQSDQWKMDFRNEGSRTQAQGLLVDEIEKADLVETKKLIRRSFADVLPDSVVTRPKMSFPTPFQEWLSGSFVQGLEEECLSIAQRTGIFNSPEIKRMFATGNRNLWLLANVCFWYETMCE